jgi:hypothetical protein
MGPSTNLSARLMGKAAEGEVMCDGETRLRDRTHAFTKLSEVQAKGYSQLVPTFRPELTRTLATNNSIAMRRIGSSVGGVVNLGGLGLQRNETISGKSLVFDPQLMIGHNSGQFFQSGNGHMLLQMATSSGSSNGGLLLMSPLAKKSSNLSRLRGKRGLMSPGGNNNHTASMAGAAGASPQVAGGPGSATEIRLEGRDEEVNEVFTFLCPDFVRQHGNLAALAEKIRVTNLTSFSPTVGTAVGTTTTTSAAAAAAAAAAPNAVGSGNNSQASSAMGLSSGGGSSKKNSRNLMHLSLLSGNLSDVYYFDVTGRTRACIVQGPSGIGKTSFLKIFCEKVRVLYRSETPTNLFVAQSQSQGNNTQPFHVWKGVIRQILLYFAQLSGPTHGVNGSAAAAAAAMGMTGASPMGSNSTAAGSPHNGTHAAASTAAAAAAANGSSSRAGSGRDPHPSLTPLSKTTSNIGLVGLASVSTDEHGSMKDKFGVVSMTGAGPAPTGLGRVELTNGLNFVTALLPEELQVLKPLMTAFQFLHGVKENDTTSKLSGATKILQMTSFLSALLQQFTTFTGKLLLFSM